jgi:uncharacterized YigZ family protein
MSPSKRYLIPSETQRTETMVSNSRFVTTIGRVTSVDEAKAFLATIRSEMPEANHHVYAYRVGYGSSVIEGMSDDGEPSGTAGPPVLSVLRGTSIGDIIIVVTRFFGGTKLGTGGLVRAYSEAAHIGINQLKTEEKITRNLLGFDIPYNLYELTKRLILKHNGMIQDETFETDITILALFPEEDAAAFTNALRELSAGRVEAVVLEVL